MKVMTRLARHLAVLALAALAVAPAARAQSCEAPPGTAAVDQYCESIPAAGGSTSGPTFRDGAPGAGGRDLAGLADSGFDGPTLAAFVERTRPATRPSAEVRGEVAESAPPESSGVVGAIAAVAGDGATIGRGFLLAILAVLAAVGGAWLWQRRTPTAA